MKKFFLAPGRALAGLFEKKKKYRSVRYKQKGGTAVVAVSLVFWLGLLALGFWLGALTRSGDGGALRTETAGQSASAEAVPAGEGPPEAAPASFGALIPFPPALSSGAAVSGGAEAGSSQAQASQAWLVILHTIPKNGQDGRAEAERRQARYKNQGLKVEIMDTGSFPRLLDGFWVVALGPFDTREAAAAKATEASRLSSDLVVKRVI